VSARAVSGPERIPAKPVLMPGFLSQHSFNGDALRRRSWDLPSVEDLQGRALGGHVSTWLVQVQKPASHGFGGDFLRACIAAARSVA